MGLLLFAAWIGDGVIDAAMLPAIHLKRANGRDLKLIGGRDMRITP